MKRFYHAMIPLVLILLAFVPGCTMDTGSASQAISYSLKDVPAYSGDPYVVIDNNEPDFQAADMTQDSFETYQELDTLGRCGTAYANIGSDLMPTESRGSIGMIKPSGWKTVRYACVDGQYLYNRCHLIGYQLTAENANPQNLITGTRYLNVDGMLPFENMVAEYIKETDNHVLYRVTPIFEGDNLVASGVQMEARSVEDDGEGILFNVYCYNVQPFITIDYKTGDSWLESEDETGAGLSQEITYILNTSSKKFHKPDCSGAKNIHDKNREEYSGTREELVQSGYTPCGTCKP
ncbi:MAG: DNA/RNA non-specific endonuclease [Eubacteriales bacterium]|nr:DNA/RNA non-specific endonuclease [Eubacteriales bacterium]